MSQTYALLMDAYRELNAKKLFWITLILSALVAGCFFLIGINQGGLKIAVWQFDNPMFNTQTTTPEAFYKLIFSSIGIRYWLGLAATALAVISTAGFFPDMMKAGAIDLILTKPISRVRLFLTRFALGLLFALLQVLAFTTICFFVIGIRGGVWEPEIFLAVPLFVLFFSYIFAVSVLVGVLTRSTIAALLITLLLWLLLIGLNTTDIFATANQFSSEVYAEELEDRLAFAEKLDGERLEQFESQYMPLESLREQAKWARESADSSAGFVRVVHLIKTPLPKTGETLDMLQRITIDAADLPASSGMEDEGPAFSGEMRSTSDIAREKAEELEKPVWWVIGTSLLFEIVLLTFAGWRFCRSDY